MHRHADGDTPHIDTIQTLEREAVHVVNALTTRELEALLVARRPPAAGPRSAQRRASTAFDTTLSWTITILSLVSSWLIIQHMWLGFVCSLVSNSLWVGRAFHKRDWPQMLLFVISLGLSIFGLVTWVR